MIRRPPIPTLTATLFPYTPLFLVARLPFRARHPVAALGQAPASLHDRRRAARGRVDPLPVAELHRTDGNDRGLQGRPVGLDPGRGVEMDLGFCNGESVRRRLRRLRSEEHTSELQSLMRISYAVFCLKKTHTTTHTPITNPHPEYQHRLLS